MLQITCPLKSRSCLQCVKITACSLPSRVFIVAVTDDGALSLNGTFFYNFLSFSFHLSHISICLKKSSLLSHMCLIVHLRECCHTACQAQGVNISQPNLVGASQPHIGLIHVYKNYFSLDYSCKIDFFML